MYEKVLGQGSENGSQNAGSQEREDSEKEMADLASIAEEKVELLCNDQVSIIDMIFSSLESYCICTPGICIQV